MAASTFPQIEKAFSVGVEVATLSITMYILGLGLGPLLMGGLSESFGRNIIYRVSFLCFFLFTFPVAFANNISVHLIFRFCTGFAGSAFLSVAGGSVADLFAKGEVATPMAVYTLSPFIGPVLGPVISGFINQHVSWRWTYYVLLIWEAVQLAALVLIIPETHVSTLTVRKAERIRKESGDLRYFAATEKRKIPLLHAVRDSVQKPFLIMFYEPMVLLLNLWTAVILGIVYLTFSVFSIIFGEVHGFSQGFVGLSYLGIGLGMVVATGSQPLWNRFNRGIAMKYKNRGEEVPPEVTLYPGMLASFLVPLGLFMFAFTIYKNVHWIIPILLIAPFGAGVVFAFTSTFTFLVSAYRPHAASTLASNSFLRSSFAGAFPLIARPMFLKMGNTGAVAFLAALTAIMAPLPFLFFQYGSQLRQKSRYAV